jgi:hypothetical protein
LLLNSEKGTNVICRRRKHLMLVRGETREGGAADRLEMRKAHTTKEFMKKGLDLIVGVMSSRDYTAWVSLRG